MQDDLKYQMTVLRKDLHKNYAERSEQEFKTARKIRSYLKEHSRAEVIELAGTGTMAVYKGERPGKTILLRADIDALPIRETNDFEHRSADPDVSHKCGHDGHTTILLAVMHLLERDPIDKGTVILLWQPAEENGMGAAAVVEDDHFRSLNIDEAYALHNLPGFPLHQLLYKSGAFTANVRSLVIELEGRTAHAAEPENGNNPAYTIARILDFVEEINNNEPEQDDFFLITPVHVHAGSKDYGIAAGNGALHLTMRSWSPKVFEQRTEKLKKYIDELSEKEGVKVSYSWTQEFWTNQNDEKVVDNIKKAGAALGMSMQELKAPFKWGEDFGLFTQQVPGAMFGIGAGEDLPALHNPDYDFPDEITMTAAELFHQILIHAL